MLPLTPHFFARHLLLFLTFHTPRCHLSHRDNQPRARSLNSVPGCWVNLTEHRQGGSGTRAALREAQVRVAAAGYKTPHQAPPPRSGKPERQEQPRPAGQAPPRLLPPARRLRPRPGAGAAVGPGPNCGRGANGGAGMGGTAGPGGAWAGPAGGGGAD